MADNLVCLAIQLGLEESDPEEVKGYRLAFRAFSSWKVDAEASSAAHPAVRIRKYKIRHRLRRKLKPVGAMTAVIDFIRKPDVSE